MNERLGGPRAQAIEEAMLRARRGADADDDVEPSPVIDFGEAAFSLGMPVTVPAGALSVSRRMRSGSR